jgi:hypothetical protein
MLNRLHVLDGLEDVGDFDDVIFDLDTARRLDPDVPHDRRWRRRMKESLGKSVRQLRTPVEIVVAPAFGCRIQDHAGTGSLILESVRVGADGTGIDLVGVIPCEVNIETVVEEVRFGMRVGAVDLTRVRSSVGDGERVDAGPE